MVQDGFGVVSDQAASGVALEDADANVGALVERLLPGVERFLFLNEGLDPGIEPLLPSIEPLLPKSSCRALRTPLAVSAER